MENQFHILYEGDYHGQETLPGNDLVNMHVISKIHQLCTACKIEISKIFHLMMTKDKRDWAMVKSKTGQ